MRKKRLFTIAVTLLLVFVVFAGTWQGSSAAFITSNTYQIGNLGIYIPNGFNPDNIYIKKVSKSSLGGVPGKFSRALMELYFVSDSGSRNYTPFVLTYVYFNLNSIERHAWEKGNLGIYYKDVNSGAWKSCYTFYNPNILDNGRVSCLASQYTTFGLVILK